MRFSPTTIPGAFVIEPERRADDRGWFARTFCADELASHGLETVPVQSSVSHNARARTLRGMHYQADPHGEAKLVSCTQGAIHDVIVELSTGRWFAIELTAAAANALYIPATAAHGFLTLTDDARVAYTMFTRYEAGSARGVRWDDPAFGIAWPHPPEVISERDWTWPEWRP